MKKINNNGFVLAETLIVTVFLMVLFTMVYSNFYPLIGEYEKREGYDDIDGKYAAYWIKKLVESAAFQPSNTKKEFMQQYGYMRFECSDIQSVDNQRDICINLVNSLEIQNCDKETGDACEIYVTNYRIGGVSPDFKSTVKTNRNPKITVTTSNDKNPKDMTTPKNSSRLTRELEMCYSQADNQTNFRNCATKLYDDCMKRRVPTTGATDEQRDKAKVACEKIYTGKVFSSAFQDYVVTLPDYITQSLNYSKYRIIIQIKHKKDGNNYYSFSTMEVNR